MWRYGDVEMCVVYGRRSVDGRSVEGVSNGSDLVNERLGGMLKMNKNWG